MKKKSIARLFSVFATVCMLVGLLPNNVYADDSTAKYWGNTTKNIHSGGDENITIAKVTETGVEWEHIAYCFNKDLGVPRGTYGGNTEENTYINEYEYLDQNDNATWKSLAVNRNYEGDMKDILTKIVYMGYPYDGSQEIRNKIINDCKVSDEYVDDVFRVATQKAIWYITDKREFKVPSEVSVPTGSVAASVSDYIGKVIYEKALAYTGETGLDTRLWKPISSSRIQNLLDTGYSVNQQQQPTEMTLEIPFTKTVTVNGDATPTETTFTLKVEPNNDVEGLTIEGTSITTNGAGEYEGTITIKGTQDAINAAGGFRITEQNDSTTNWKYDTAEYTYMPTDSGYVLEKVGGGSVIR